MAKFCQACGAEITKENASFCESCGIKLLSGQPEKNVVIKETRAETKKESNLDQALKYGAICCGGIVIIAIIAAFVYGMGSSPSISSSGQPIQTSTVPQVTTTTRSGAPTQIDVSIGQSVSNPERQVTVFSAQKNPTYTWRGAASSYTYTEQPKPGNTFIIVDTDIKNIGSDRIYASSGDFSMSDSEGNRYDPEFYAGDDGLSILQELYKNQKTRGKLIFEVPQNAKKLKLYYDLGNLFTGTKLASWSVN